MTSQVPCVLHTILETYILHRDKALLKVLDLCFIYFNLCFNNKVLDTKNCRFRLEENIQIVNRNLLTAD